MFRSKKSVFDKIDDYLLKKGHEVVFSIFLENYNGNTIFIRFDYDRTLSVYKLIWVDLNFFDEKNIEKYISMQIMTNVLGNRLVDCLNRIHVAGESRYDENVYGDRVEVISYQQNYVQEFIFSRFLPLDWKFLIDPIVIAFSYLPRSMETFLNEFFAKYDGFEEKYNYLKPIKFNFYNGDFASIFKKSVISKGQSYYEMDKVLFLEKVLDKYLAVVEGVEPYLVMIREVNDVFTLMWCSCKCDFLCKHVLAVVLAIRNKKFNRFYKVKYITKKNQSLLEKMSSFDFLLCCGFSDSKILLVGENHIRSENVLDKDGHLQFEVIEDDDYLSLSHFLESFKK